MGAAFPRPASTNFLLSAKPSLRVPLARSLTPVTGILGVVFRVFSLPFEVAWSARGVIRKTIDPSGVAYGQERFKQACQDNLTLGSTTRNSGAALAWCEQNAGLRSA
jgi:hypothetical protein